ncbi:MAG: hypothetical protein WBG73_21220 [Coleofasciculaceae cyanobacterium]
MPTRLLVMGSMMAVGAAASLLLFNQNSSRPPISIIPTPSSNNSPQTFQKKKNVLTPLLPSLAKPPTSTTELSLKKPQPEQNISSQILAKPTITSVKTKQFVPNTSTKSTLQKPLPTITPTISRSLNSRRFVSTGEAELSTNKSPLVFTHRSRPILPPIDYPIVPTESLATPMPIVETPMPNSLRESLATPKPIAETPTPTPLKPLATPILIQPLATPTPTTSTNLLATPTPTQVTPIISPSAAQPTP